MKINGTEVTVWGVVASLAIIAVIAFLRAVAGPLGDRQEHLAKEAEVRRIRALLDKSGAESGIERDGEERK